MKKFYQVARRRFCSNYHHDFVPREDLKKPNNFLVLFDFARVMLYVFLTGAFVFQLPGYFLFSRKNFRNNPDYILLDEEAFKSKQI
jgi:hypothetical protein